MQWLFLCFGNKKDMDYCLFHFSPFSSNFIYTISDKALLYCQDGESEIQDII